ncbi:hypothetical protein ACQRD0_02905 [Streptococcus alactolyticus]|uniref:hypothetical protein n=1 Tax=Streptococcus alactolyticus TaxID=29389 RepID=UPI003CFE3796
MISVITTILLFNVLTSFSMSSALMTFRDVFIPLITGFFLCSVEVSENEKRWFFNRLSLICMVALVCGLFLGIIQYINGWQWTSAWYTGYSFWGEDKRSSLYIMGNGLHVRVPSIAGHSVKFGMYSFFQYLVVAFDDVNDNGSKTKIKNIMFAIIMLINVYISNNKTTIVIALFLATIWGVKKFNKYSKIIVVSFVVLCGMYIYFAVLPSSDFMISFYDRFTKWAILKEPQLLKNIIFPVSTYNFAGNSATEIPVLNYWDNTYFYFAFSFGAIGFVSVINWLKSLYQYANERKYGLAYYLTIFTAIAAATTSIVLGRCFFSIYVIMMAYLAAHRKGNDK